MTSLPFEAAVHAQPDPLKAKYVALVRDIESPLTLNGFEKAQRIMLLYAQMSADRFDEASLRAAVPNSKIHSYLISVSPIVEMCKSTEGTFFAPNKELVTLEVKDNAVESEDSWRTFLQNFSLMSEDWDLIGFKSSLEEDVSPQ